MRKFLKILRNILIILLALILVVFIITRITGAHRSDPADILSYGTNNPFITGSTECIAHRFGAEIAPEESLLAIRTCLAEGSGIAVDMFEFDLRMTADGHAVVFHDSTLDRATDAEQVLGKTDLPVSQVTLEQLKTLNMGAGFTDIQGNQPYATLETVPEELRVMTLAQALDCLTGAGVTRFSIEAKDPGELGMKAMDLLYTQLKERNLLGSTIVSSFKTDVSAYARDKYPDMIRSNTDAQAFEFYLAALTDDPDYEPPCQVFQLPFNNKYLGMGVNFGTAKVINYAHKHNVAIQFWVVDQPDRMEYLASLGVDGIMSDRPDLLTDVLAKS